MHFKNPANGYIESSSVPFLWCLLFGALYFAVKGIWAHVFIYIVLGCCTVGVSMLIYPFFAKSIVHKAYARRGWQLVGGAYEQHQQLRQEPALHA
jgi:hypothetical protein